MPLEEAGDTLEGITTTIDLHGRIEVHDGLYVLFCNEFPLIGTGWIFEDAISSFFKCLREYIRLSPEWSVPEEMVENWNQHTADISSEFTLSLPRKELGMPVSV